jgi:hypothetical protein
MRLWFNRGFSLAPIARAMMAADPALEVFVSVGPGKPVYDGPTATWIEPDLEGEDYADWARGMVIEHAIDVLVPTRQRRLLADTALPCRIELPASPAVLEILDDKYAFAEAMEGEDFHLPTFAAASSRELRALLRAFRCDHPDAAPCVKPRFGVNGHGFWKLTEKAPLSHLMHPEYRNIRGDVFLAALSAEEEERPIAPIVLMEYLPGPEVSLDLLAHQGRVLRALARTKHGSRQRIESAHELIPAAERLVARFGLHGLVNAQFRRANDGSWKVLEINARPAGGAVYAEQFGGGFVADWGGLLTGRLSPAEINRTPLDVEVEFTRTLVLVG